jgi:hypothetical protein
MVIARMPKAGEQTELLADGDLLKEAEEGESYGNNGQD